MHVILNPGELSRADENMDGAKHRALLEEKLLQHNSHLNIHPEQQEYGLY